MRLFHTSGASWYFFGPDRSRDAAEQLGQDLWALAEPTVVAALIPSIHDRIEREADAAGPAGIAPEHLASTVLDGVHDTAAGDLAAIRASQVPPDLVPLCACISDAFAESADTDTAAQLLGRLAGTLEALVLQAGGDPQVLALTSSVAMTIDAPLCTSLEGFFEVHDTALRRLFAPADSGEDRRRRVDAFFDAQLDMSRVRSAGPSGDRHEVRGRLESAKAAFLSLGLRVEAASCDRRLAMEARRAGDPDTAWERLAAARATLGEFGAQREVGLCHLQAGLLLLDRDEYDRALTEAETALSMFTDLRAWYELEISAEVCSRAAERLGDLERALAMARFAHLMCDSRMSGEPSPESLISPS